VNIGAVLVGIALLVLAVAYVARPLFEKQARGNNGHVVSARPRSTEAHERQDQLTARRDAVYALIRELDADFQTGKITEEDFRAQRERYVMQGVSLLKQLDTLSSDGAFEKVRKSGGAALEAEIEAAVLELRQKPGFREHVPWRAVPGKPGFYEPATRFCTQCGQPAALEDNFCGQCGAPLKRTAPQ
jgi:hypothetical protein